MQEDYSYCTEISCGIIGRILLKKSLRRSKRALSVLLAMSIMVTSSGVQTMAQGKNEKTQAVVKNNIESKKEISMSYDRITKQLEEGTYKGEKIGGTENE